MGAEWICDISSIPVAYNDFTNISVQMYLSLLSMPVNATQCHLPVTMLPPLCSMLLC